MNWALIAAVNDGMVLKNTLLNSPDVREMKQVILRTGFSSASTAYNSALDECQGDVAILAHQDVYLPPGWLSRLHQSISIVESIDRDWGVLGMFGIDLAGNHCGYIYSTGLGRTFGKPSQFPTQVVSIDEMVIVVRTGTGLRFDSSLPGYHLYGTDICLEANRLGLSTFVTSNFCIHNSNGLRCLPGAFWKAYGYMKRKWRPVLPIKTTCITIAPGYGQVIRKRVFGWLQTAVERTGVGVRVSDPAELYRRLTASGEIVAPDLV